MSENTEAKAPDPKPAPKKGALGAILGLLLPAILSAASSYGAVRAANRHHEAPAHPPEPPRWDPKPPGPTVALEPFLVSVQDEARKAHPMRLTIAVEFDATVKEETLKAFTPRIRDAVLAHLRTLRYEDAVDSQHQEKLRGELLERCRSVGALAAERILVTDLVVQ